MAVATPITNQVRSAVMKLRGASGRVRPLATPTAAARAARTPIDTPAIRTIASIGGSLAARFAMGILRPSGDGSAPIDFPPLLPSSTVGSGAAARPLSGVGDVDWPDVEHHSLGGVIRDLRRQGAAVRGLRRRLRLLRLRAAVLRTEGFCF